MNLGNGKGPKHTGRSLISVTPTTSVSTNFSKSNFSKSTLASCSMRAPTPRPTIDYEPGGIWIKSPYSSNYLAQVSNGTDEIKSSGKTEDKIIAIARKSPSVSIPQIAEILGISTRTVEKQIRQLKQAKRHRRIGPAKGGHWQVVV